MIIIYTCKQSFFLTGNGWGDVRWRRTASSGPTVCVTRIVQGRQRHHTVHRPATRLGTPLVAQMKHCTVLLDHSKISYSYSYHFTSAPLSVSTLASLTASALWLRRLMKFNLKTKQIKVIQQKTFTSRARCPMTALVVSYIVLWITSLFSIITEVHTL